MVVKKAKIIAGIDTVQLEERLESFLSQDTIEVDSEGIKFTSSGRHYMVLVLYNEKKKKKEKGKTS